MWQELDYKEEMLQRQFSFRNGANSTQSWILLRTSYPGVIKIKLISNQKAVIGGLEFAKQTFKLIDKKIKFSASAFSASAQEKIEKAGGEIIIL